MTTDEEHARAIIVPDCVPHQDEPILYFFWRACHHGVPLDERCDNLC